MRLTDWMVLTPLAFIAALPALLQAQVEVIPRVEAQAIATTVVPARAGDEGPLRYDAQPPVDRDSYVPRMPVFEPRPASAAPSHPVSYDTLTGIETEHPVPMGPFGPLGSVAGSSFGAAVEQQGYQNLGSPPTAVNATVSPWQVHARMWFHDTLGGSFVCSGTLIDPRTLLTAGHCVHEGNGGGWMTNVVVSPAWDGDDDAFGSANGVQLSTWSAWSTSGDWNYDQGYVRLDRPVGLLSGWFGYSYNNDNAWWSSTTLHGIGWPGGCFAGAPDQLYYAGGTFPSVTDYTITSPVNWPCWAGGMSGGGIYWIDGASRIVGAVNSNGLGKPSQTTSLTCNKITAGKYDYIANTWVPGAYSTSVVDLVPLAVTAGDVEAGKGIPGMSYQVFNNSLYDPLFTTVYPVDVYLSTNDNISSLDTLIEHHTFSWNFGPKSSVTVNMGAPTVPLSTPPGTYWAGVILDVADGNVVNNETDGWDAAQIQVTPFVSPCSNTAYKIAAGLNKPGAYGAPMLNAAVAPTVPMFGWQMTVTHAYPYLTGYMIVGLSYLGAPFDGGKMYPYPDLTFPFPVNASGAATLSFDIPPYVSACGVSVWFQAMFPNDPGAAGARKTAQTNYLAITFGK